MVLFGTGEGTVQPAVPDGLLISGTLTKPAASVTVTVGGRSSSVLYAGGAPGMVSGVLQVNMQVAIDAPSGSQVPVQLHANGVSSPANVTIAVE